MKLPDGIVDLSVLGRLVSLSSFGNRMIPMPAEIVLSRLVDTFPKVSALPQAHMDSHLIDIWLHSRSYHTESFMGRRALIAGSAGHDGSCLAVLLVFKEYVAHGMVRRTGSERHGKPPFANEFRGELILAFQKGKAA
jgi:hypothetical protein